MTAQLGGEMRLVCTFVVAWCGVSAVGHAEILLNIRYDEDRTAGETCANVLQMTASSSFRHDDVVVILNAPIGPTEYSLQPKSPEIDISLGGGADGEGARQVMRLPFAFRNPEHFRAYLASDAFRTIVSADDPEFVDAAYGGFVQLFSGANAMTKREHFYDRSVGGEYRSAFEWTEAFVGAGAFGLSFYDPSVDLDQMAQNPNFMAAVTVPLLDGPKYGAKRAARFLNLFFIAADPVFFLVDFDPDVSLASREAALTWIKEAAAACSARNFELEKGTISELEDAGIMVVPADVDTFAQPAWVSALKSKSLVDEWTVADFDALVHVASDANGDLPSSGFASIDAEQMQNIQQWDAAIEAERHP